MIRRRPVRRQRQLDARLGPGVAVRRPRREADVADHRGGPSRGRRVGVHAVRAQDPGDLLRAQPRHQAVDLDVERLVAIEVEAQRVVGHEGEAVDLALQAHVLEGTLVGELDAAKRFLRVSGRGRELISSGFPR